MPATAAERDGLLATDRAHRTTAPITRCAHDALDVSAPPLRWLRARYAARIEWPHVTLRARLLFGRAGTADIRLRFPTDAAAAAASARCTHAQCAADGTIESIEHMLLACPRYNEARARLGRALAGHGLVLDLRNMLNPPERGASRFLALCHASDVYFASIQASRLAYGLPGLGSCPRHSRRIAAAPPAGAAPPPLDTG